MTPLDEKIPDKIKRLGELAYNLWWSWTPEAREIFRRLDYPLWRSTRHNPVQMLQEISPVRLAEAANDAAFVRRYNKIMLRFDNMMNSDETWFNKTYPELKDKTLAYFFLLLSHA